MTNFITHLHCIVGGVGEDSSMMRVSKDLGMMGVGKDSGMVYEWVSSHFMA